MEFSVSVTAAPLREKVLDILRSAITERHFEPGGRLVERELCDLMQVSRSSIREALRQLESEGLIDLIPNVGPVRNAVAAGDEVEMLAAKSNLYDVLAEGCGNAVASDQLRQMRAQVTLLRGVTLSERERVAESLSEIEDMLKAIQARDGEKAWASAITHIEKCADAAILALRKANLAQQSETNSR